MNTQHNKSCTCTVCGLTLETYKKRLHHEVTHIESMNTLCHICGVTIKHGNFKRHMTTMHAPGKIAIIFRMPDSALKPMKCHFCDYTSTFKKHLNLHINTEHPEEFKANRRLLSIPKQSTDRLKCNICGQKNFLNFGQLTDHRQMHKNHECTICKRKFTAKQNLETHIRNHSDKLRPFKCSVCILYYLFVNKKKSLKIKKKSNFN